MSQGDEVPSHLILIIFFSPPPTPPPPNERRLKISRHATGWEMASERDEKYTHGRFVRTEEKRRKLILKQECVYGTRRHNAPCGGPGLDARRFRVLSPTHAARLTISRRLLLLHSHSFFTLIRWERERGRDRDRHSTNTLLLLLILVSSRQCCRFSSLFPLR
uniref:Uncharacterized protein n=2 Tax=Caenorhabditis japonica TaxID=281687 RepID=A0A8R1INL2_CAEJA